MFVWSALFLAQAVSPGSFDFTPWLPVATNFGLGGLMLWMFLRRRLRMAEDYDEMKGERNLERERADVERERADKADARADVAHKELYEVKSAIAITNKLLEGLKTDLPERH